MLPPTAMLPVMLALLLAVTVLAATVNTLLTPPMPKLTAPLGDRILTLLVPFTMLVVLPPALAVTVVQDNPPLPLVVKTCPLAPPIMLRLATVPN